MADMASFFQNPFIIVVLTALAVVLLLVGFVAAKILLNQRLADRRVATVADNLAQIGDTVIRLHLSLETIGERLREMRERLVVWLKTSIKAGKSFLIWHKISVVTSK